MMKGDETLIRCPEKTSSLTGGGNRRWRAGLRAYIQWHCTILQRALPRASSLESLVEFAAKKFVRCLLSCGNPIDAINQAEHKERDIICENRHCFEQ
jgi:hypothetical protein